jgi:hypothetical protein
MSGAPDPHAEFRARMARSFDHGRSMAAFDIKALRRAGIDLFEMLRGMGYAIGETMDPLEGDGKFVGLILEQLELGLRGGLRRQDAGFTGDMLPFQERAAMFLAGPHERVRKLMADSTLGDRLALLATAFACLFRRDP